MTGTCEGASAGAGAGGSRTGCAPVSSPSRLSGSSPSGATTGQSREQLLAHGGRGDPGRRLLALRVRVPGVDLLERLGGRKAGARHVVARRQPGPEVRLAAPCHPFDDRDDGPAERHHADDLERAQLRERKPGRERGQEQNLEDEP